MVIFVYKELDNGDAGCQRSPEYDERDVWGKAFPIVVPIELPQGRCRVTGGGAVRFPGRGENRTPNPPADFLSWNSWVRGESRLLDHFGFCDFCRRIL